MALREGEARFRALLEALPNAVWVAGPDGGIEYVNERWLEYTGLSREAALGPGTVETIHPDDRERVLGGYLPALREGRTWECEYRIRRSDGEWRWHIGRSAPQRDGEGRLLGGLGTTTDIDDRKRAEVRGRRLSWERAKALAEAKKGREAAEAVRERVLRLQALSSALSGALTPAEVARVGLTQSLAATGAVEGGVALLRRSPPVLELIEGANLDPRHQATWARFSVRAQVPPAEAVRTDRAIWLESMREAAHRYPPIEGQGPWTTDRATASLPLSVDGRILGVLGLSFHGPRPFPEAEKAFLMAIARQCAQAIHRATLYEAEQKARARLAALAAATQELDREHGDFRALLDALTRRAADLVGDAAFVSLLSDDGCRLLPESAHHRDPEAMEVLRALQPRSPHPVDRGALRRVLDAGRTRALGRIEPERLRQVVGPEWWPYLERVGVHGMLLVPLRARGRALGLLLLTRDAPSRPYDRDDRALLDGLADRAAVAVDNARLYRDAQESNRLKDEFLAMLGHELRNPLGSIGNTLQLMDRAGDAGDPDGRNRAVIRRQVRHLSRLVDDLLDVARISTGKMVLREARLDLRDIAERCAEACRSQAEAREQEFTLEVPEGPVPVEGDGARLQQVLTNLVDNAIKYTPPGGRIDVSVRVEDGGARVHVRDDGVGIPAPLLPRVFDLFTQAGAPTGRTRSGLGLGLALVRRLVDMHGGSVWARSDGEGRGSEFTVRLPLATGAAEAPGGGPALPRPAPASRRILVVEDNADVREPLRDLLVLEGHDVRAVADGLAATTIAPSFRPHMAIVDIGLPGIDGFEVARRLRAELGGSVRLLALTGFGQREDRERALASGFDGHAVKPMDLERVLAWMEEERPS
ncbi:ATP-binding protein [Myxococcota bacterium]|nr:ATP-binding protein [Myxococcota bacterium]